MINNSNNILYQDSIPFFTTILDLRAYANYEQGDVVEVGGRTSIGDGFGSKFIYDGTSTQADDNEYVIRPDNIAQNGSGRWLINGWGFLNDKMDSDTKNLTGMTITNSTLDSSKITNSTLDNVTVPPTTDWTANTVPGALDIDNRYETKGSVANDINTAVSSALTESKNYTDTGLALKANLADGNTFTGNQVINGGLSVTNTSGTVYGNTAGSSKWYISRKDSQNCTTINSYNGSWHYLSIMDDGTIQCNNGTLALQSAVDEKANLSGGNTLSGSQTITNGSLVVQSTDNSSSSLIKDTEATLKGAVIRYNDGTTNHDWTLNDDSIIAPNGSVITTGSNYVTLTADNAFTGTNTVPAVTDFTTSQILDAKTADARYIKSLASGTNTRIDSIVQNSDSRTVSGSTVLANLSDLPLSDPQMKLQIFRVQTLFNSAIVTVTFPRAFKPGTTPYVIIPSSQEINGAEWYSVLGICEGTGDGGLSITNTSFNVFKMGWAGGTGWYGNTGTVTFDVIAGGYF